MGDIKAFVPPFLLGFVLLFAFSGCATLECPPCPEPVTAARPEKTIESKPIQKVEEKTVEPEELPPQVEAPAKEPPPKPEYYIHKVQWNGECLTIISKWYTSRFDRWPIIVKANPGMNPNRINLGDEIKIPMDLLITDNPMPRAYVFKFISSSKK